MADAFATGETRAPEAGWFETVIRMIPDAVIYADAEGIIRFWNAGAERIFGFAAVGAVGQSLDIIIPASLRARHWDGFRQVVATGESRCCEGDLLSVPRLRKDGTRISLEFTIAALRDEAGRMQGLAAVLRDVTPRFEELRQFRKTVGALQEEMRGAKDKTT